MQQVFLEESRRIEAIEAFTGSLDERAVSQILNQEFFYHASRELSSHIPTDRPSSQTLAAKLLQQVAARPDPDTLIEQLDHRLQVLLDPRSDQLADIAGRFEKDRERMRECGARVRDYAEIYEEELRGVGIPNGLAKRAIGYFEASSREWALDEMLGDLIEGLQPQEEEEHLAEGEPFDEETKQEMDSLIDQLKLVNSCFNFST